MGLEFIDGDPGPFEAELLGAEVDAVATGLAAPTVSATALAHHIVCQVLAPP